MGCGSTKEKFVEDPKNAKTVAPEKAKADAAPTAAAGGNHGLNLLKELSGGDDKSRGIAALLAAAGEPTSTVAPPAAPPVAPPTTEAPKAAEEPKPAETAPAAQPRDIGAFDLKTRARMAQRGPYAVEVEAGKTYYWCVCGHSKTQPFCDGSHVEVNAKEGTDFSPVEFTATEAKTVYLCGCKQTSTAPYCDGSHSKLPEEKKAEEAAPVEEKPAEPKAEEKPAEAPAAEAAPAGSGLRSVDILKELADEQKEGGREYRGINLLHEVLTAAPTA